MVYSEQREKEFYDNANNTWLSFSESKLLRLVCDISNAEVNTKT